MEVPEDYEAQQALAGGYAPKLEVRDSGSDSGMSRRFGDTAGDTTSLDVDNANSLIIGTVSRGEEKQPRNHRRIRQSRPRLRREDAAVTADILLLSSGTRRWELWMER